MKKTKGKREEDLTGSRFGRWTVTAYAGYDRRHLWATLCACGGIGTVGEYQLKNGLSKSCGCLAAEINRARETTHGESLLGKRTPEFRAYILAKNQCENPRHENFGKFGAVGIEFRFANFKDFLSAAGRRPDRDFVLSRSDRAGHYEAGNVEWTRNRNRRVRSG